MAVSRYDQRKNLEEAEANAIGTEYSRADLLPADDASFVRDLLRKYIDQRIAYYLAHDERSVESILMQKNYRQNFGLQLCVSQKHNRHP
jgi:hypothetical protein